MAKVYNITDKLSAENTAILEVFDEKLEFKTDAETVFKALEVADENTKHCRIFCSQRSPQEPLQNRNWILHHTSR